MIIKGEKTDSFMFKENLNRDRNLGINGQSTPNLCLLFSPEIQQLSSDNTANNYVTPALLKG